MLASAAQSHDDFAALSNYLLHGKAGETVSPARVSWIVARNLASDDPLRAAKIMAATAKLSARVEKPVYHASIAWHPDEQPTDEEMRAVADGTLELMGLAEHQALVVAHGDTDHRHLHLMVNRVHPGSGKAWRTSHDYLRLDRAMKQLADSHGFDYVPAHRYNADDALEGRRRGPHKAAVQKARREGVDALPQMPKDKAREIGAEMQRLLPAARGWGDLDVLAGLAGYLLETKGQGAVLADGNDYAKFSSLGLTESIKALEGLFGSSLADHRRRAPELVDGVDIAKALVTLGLAERRAIRIAVEDAMQQREAARSERSLKEEVAAALRAHQRRQHERGGR